MKLTRRRFFYVLIALTCFALPSIIEASGDVAHGNTAEAAHGLNPLVLIGIAVMLAVAKLGGELFDKLKLPAVLGELVGGIVIGNLTLFGLTFIEPIKTSEVITALAEIGVILLLFEVGLESNVKEMLEVGWSSLLVAIAGVIAPFFLGWGIAAFFLPHEARLGHIFIGAILCATSVGITARVLKDINKLQSREARIILGAAVIDDVLGLLILAVVSGAIKAAGAGETLAVMDVVIIAAKSVAFLIAAVLVGQYVMPHIFRNASRFATNGIFLTLSIAFCFGLAWASALVGLAPIVGAFAAGLVLDEVHFEPFLSRGEDHLPHLLAPIGTFLVPVFFVLMGLKVDLRAFGKIEVLGFAAALTVAAIIGKQICSLATVEKKINRLAIGFGMIPRGEVGLIFAGIGATLVLPNDDGVAEPVVSSATFAAAVIMVIITTLVAPPLLKWALAQDRDQPPVEAQTEE